MSVLGRMSNSSNPHQGTAHRVLCVCSAGLLRSPTAARILSAEPFNFNTRSAGANPEFALVVLDKVLVNWAYTIIVMDRYQAAKVADLVDPEYGEPTIIILDTPDIYGYMAPELVALMTEQFNGLFPND